MTINITLNYYEKNAKQFVEQTLNVNMLSLYTPFISSLPQVSSNEQHILDLGCGSGRDSLYFANHNFKATAVDGSQKLINLARKSNALINNIDWYCMNFLQLDEQSWHNKFTGIWACASLLHIPYVELPSLINSLLDMLTTHGVMYASFKYGNSERVDKDRFFCDLNEERWAMIKNKLDKRINDKLWITQDRRVNRDCKWLNILIRMD